MTEFGREYASLSTPDLVKIANADEKEYRPEAIEAARAELANRGENWRQGKRGSRSKPDQQGPERDWRSRRDHLMMQYAVCWALLAFGAVSMAVSLVSLYREGDFSSWNKSAMFPAVLILFSLFALRGLHRQLFRSHGRSKKAGPLLSLVDRLESLRPPPVEGETGMERNREGKT